MTGRRRTNMAKKPARKARPRPAIPARPKASLVRVRAIMDRGWPASRELRRVAHVPNIVIVKWLQEGLDIFDPDPEMQKRYRAKLNDPDWRWLRTAPGKV